MTELDDEERARLTKKLRSYVKRRNEVRTEIEDLTKDEKTLGDKIKVLLDQLGETNTTNLFPKMAGYRLDRPKAMVFNEDRLSAWLKENAPKAHKVVFERKVVFNKKKLDEAVQAGDIPGIDDVLSDDEYVTFTEMTPRLMPTKAKKA